MVKISNIFSYFTVLIFVFYNKIGRVKYICKDGFIPERKTIPPVNP